MICRMDIRPRCFLLEEFHSGGWWQTLEALRGLQSLPGKETESLEFSSQVY